MTTNISTHEWLIRIKADRYIDNSNSGLSRRKQYFLFGWQLINTLDIIIRNAENYVQVVTPYLNKNKLIYALRGACRKNKRIDIIIRTESVNNNLDNVLSIFNNPIILDPKTRTPIQNPRKQNIPVFFYKKRDLHDKIVIVDGRIAVVSSFNLFLRNYAYIISTNSGIITWNKAVVKQIQEYYKNELLAKSIKIPYEFT